MIETGPTPAIHGVVRWRLIDLCQWLWDEFRISLAKSSMSREVRALGYRKLSARPRHHAQADGAVEAFKKTFPPAWRKSPPAKNVARADIEIWFADEARIGQKNKITRRWARRGSRPSAPHDQRTASTYIFGAICPSEGKGAALRAAALPHPVDEPASRRDRYRDRARQACCAPARSGRLASLA
jgi:hypothetical protein